jgi:hypothetical protein
MAKMTQNWQKGWKLLNDINSYFADEATRSGEILAETGKRQQDILYNIADKTMNFSFEAYGAAVDFWSEQAQRVNAKVSPDAA